MGVLKSNGAVVYEYIFKGHSCAYRKVLSDSSFTEWMETEYLISEMRD